MKTALELLWLGLRGVLFTLAALVMFIEEWGWRPLTEWAARLARWWPLARLEERIRRVTPRTALLLFLVPALALFPVKLFAVWLIHVGRPGVGVAAIVAAKVIGTALVGRLFIITETQLVQYAWFARALAWWRETKLRIAQTLRSSIVWRAVSRSRRRLSVWMRRMLHQAR
jgi:hypothetical protein